jgi:uncharacterized membrane protein YfcA
MIIGIGIVVGLVLGLTGAGGSMLAVPLLMWALHISVTQAAPLALLAISAAASLGTLVAWRQARVRYRAALLMGAMGILVAPVGLALAHRLPQIALELVLGATMLVVAARMLARAETAPGESRVVRGNIAETASGDVTLPCQVNAATGRFRWTLRCGTVLAAIGGVTGFLSGLLGVGGGFVIVPGLRSFTELSMPAAVATSLMVISLTSMGAAVGHVLTGNSFAPGVVAPFIAGALIGMLVGAVVAPRLAGPSLQKIFGATMATAAAVLLTQALARV